MTIALSNTSNDPSPIAATKLHGAGIGFRRCMADEIDSSDRIATDFMEIAPENWINLGGRMGKQFKRITERYPFIAHGLSLSIGSPSPLDMAFLQDLKAFLSEHNIVQYSEHLSYCSDDGHLYDLMPIPFTEESVRYVADRIRRVQETIEQRIAIENVSYYAAPFQKMSEIDFLNAVLTEADCDLLLDVNNIYVNSINHRYDAESFLSNIPGDRIAYIHVAGHYVEDEDLLVDTHGATVKPSVWQLLAKTYEWYGVKPTLLERDFNIPPLSELIEEQNQIKTIQAQYEDGSGKRLHQTS